MNEFWKSPSLVSAFFACLIAQLMKPFIHKLAHGKWSFSCMLSTGGMPSSHTSSVVALMTAIGLTEGIRSPYFAISFVFGLIVMYDAMHIRQEAGKQAEVINEWSRMLSDIHKDGPFAPENLKTMLGHSFSQVIGGTVLGLIVGLCTVYNMHSGVFSR